MAAGNTDRTKNTYGFLWTRNDNSAVCQKCHFDMMQEVIDIPILRGSLGIDVGSGPGYDTYRMAVDNPFVNIVSIDISDGVYKTRELTRGLKNTRIIKSSVLELPLKGGVFDFAYSFGVLHHTADPKKALSEIARILKNNSPAFLYLYEDHSENPLKYIAVKVIGIARGVTVRMPKALMYIISWLISPFVFAGFSIPSKILRNFALTRHVAYKMPFNFGTGPFSLRGDLYDRFAAPLEYRFSRQAVYNMLTECGFYDITITRLKENAGWVAWGYKK